MNIKGVQFELEYLFAAWVFGIIIAFILRQVSFFVVRNIAYFPESPPSRKFSIRKELILASAYALAWVVGVVLWRVNFFESIYVKLRLLMLGKM